VAATLCYAVNGTGSDGYHVFTPPRFYLWKFAISECIQIPQLGFVNWRCYKFYTACNRCDANKMWAVFPCLSTWLAFAVTLTGGSLYE